MRTTLTMLTLWLVAALAGNASAQTHLYSPAHLASTEGRSYSSFFGAWADARYQFCDGEHRNRVAVIKEVAYRLDYRRHSTYLALGRNWSRVQIQMANGDFRTFTNNFTNNIGSNTLTYCWCIN